MDDIKGFFDHSGKQVKKIKILMTQKGKNMTPILYIIIPCYNEQQVLPITSGLFLEKLEGMIVRGIVNIKLYRGDMVGSCTDDG